MSTIGYNGNANLVNYSKETLLAFNSRETLLRDSVHTEFFNKGYQAVFLVGDTGRGYSSQRAPGGDLIPKSITADQYTATFKALFSTAEKTDEEIDFSQASWRKLMLDSVVGEVRRTVDKQIIDELDNATHAVTTTQTIITAEFVAQLKKYLTSNRVPNDGNLTLLCGPSMFAALSSNTTFSNSLYTKNSPNVVDNNKPAWEDKPMKFVWQGLNIIEHPLVPINTSTLVETCYMFHKNSIGSAMDMDNANPSGAVQMGADGKNRKQWTNAYFKVANKIIQNDGIIKNPFKTLNPLTIS